MQDNCNARARVFIGSATNARYENDQSDHKISAQVQQYLFGWGEKRLTHREYEH